jgi:hypothetical protein
MNDDEKKPKLMGLMEHVQSREDGSWRVDVHGPSCERTREVESALSRGQAPPHPDAPKAARCGPAKVTTDAYRSGWDGIFGRKQEVGQA